MEVLTFKNIVRINEMKSSPQITMPLKEVIANGKVTNMVQIVIMSQLMNALKHFRGSEATRYIYEVAQESSSASLIDSLKKMPGSDQVHLARELLDQISGDYDLYPVGCESHQLRSVSDIQK
jgi:hypothetical protein